MKQGFKTELIPASDAAIQKAAELLKKGQVVALPTETVYGLFANALNSEAVACIFKAKGRPQDNPLIVHVADESMLLLAVEKFPHMAQKLAKAFWPGPLTIVLAKASGLAQELSAGLKTVGVRMPANPVVRAVIKAAGVPLAGPSANLSGGPSPTTARHVMADLGTKIPLIIDGGNCPVGVESTIVSLVGEPTLLRPGFISREEIEEVLGVSVHVAAAVAAPLLDGESPQSPGMKYKHYAPKAKITIIDGAFDAFAEFAVQNKTEGTFVLCFEGEDLKIDLPAVCYGRQNDAKTQASALFTALRTLDEKGAVSVFARMPSAGGVGFAVYNRLLRAAAFKVVKL